jgi:hypothetical protein
MVIIQKKLDFSYTDHPFSIFLKQKVSIAHMQATIMNNIVHLPLTAKYIQITRISNIAFTSTGPPPKHYTLKSFMGDLYIFEWVTKTGPFCQQIKGLMISSPVS